MQGMPTADMVDNDQSRKVNADELRWDSSLGDLPAMGRV